MPTYSYLCKDCQHAFDIVQSFSEDALTECPECRGTLRKKFGNVGVAFKGSGFYRNDSRGSSETADSSSAGSSSAGTSSSAGSSSDGGSAGSSSSESSSPAAAPAASGAE